MQQSTDRMHAFTTKACRRQGSCDEVLQANQATFMIAHTTAMHAAMAAAGSFIMMIICYHAASVATD
jgi:hypothetical protein